MSRRREAITYEHVALDVLCPADHRVGLVIKAIAPSPFAGRYSTGRGVRFEEWPDPTDDSGRLRGNCRTCGADVQVSWSRAKAELDAHENAGKHTGEIRG